MMPIHIRTRWLDYSPALHAHARTRVESALHPWRSHVGRVMVRIADVDGAPRARSCAIAVSLDQGGWVSALAVDDDAYRAVDAAARRIRSVVRRRIGRSRDVLRGAA
jgi:ribosome-associated translation inhibitor RaiA